MHIKSNPAYLVLFNTKWCTMASHSNPDLWMGAASSDIRISSNSGLELEGDSSWKAPKSSRNTSNMDVAKQVVQDTMRAASFCKGVLDEEWYTPETSLMELSSYSSPYGAQDARSNFSLLDSSLNYDNGNLMANFRPAPSSTLGIGQLESNRILSDLACTGQCSSVGLLSSRHLRRSTTTDSLGSGLPTSFSQGAVIPSGSLSNITSRNTNTESTNFPPSFSDAYNAPALDLDKTGKECAGDIRDKLEPYQTNKRMESYPPRQQAFSQKRAASPRSMGGGTVSPTSKSPPRVVTSTSNDSSVDIRDEDSPHVQNFRGAELHSGSDDPNDIGIDGDDHNGKDDDDLDESGDGSGGPYEVEEGAGNGTQNNGKSKAKGKRGLPAKNLMAERRRRQKLNDRLYMLRSVVPKITKMDRASILGDAIEYLKELLQRINDIHNELEEAKLEQSRSMPSSPTPRSTHHGYPTAVKEECPVLPNPESQPPRVEVRKREGQALNIHMFCARRPGLLLSTVRALDALGLDVQQAVISCFNGFALDLFRAEAKDVDVGPEEIKAVLLLTAEYGMHSLQ
nr:uncharacterized protein LOC112292197 isoform X2 [Physcomitrium patens]|eukprot:XP_024396339.1 uncharacterized protein LOC112292197 isoform X2 [Physcomitrella patens]